MKLMIGDIKQAVKKTEICLLLKSKALHQNIWTHTDTHAREL